LNNNRRCKRIAGFSLVELVVVIFVLILMASVVYPKIRSGGDLKTVSRQVIGTIQHAYSSAESEKQPYRLHYDLTYGEYWVSAAPTAVDNDASQDAKPDQPRLLPSGIKFSKIETMHFGAVVVGRAFTNFYPIGRVEPTVIYLQNEEHETLSLSINPLTARVTVSSHAE
tara:strand:- start:2143 stop:2649 length:507 start_codon:yes stop_codon:yes gene_type:complete